MAPTDTSHLPTDRAATGPAPRYSPIAHGRRDVSAAPEPPGDAGFTQLIRDLAVDTRTLVHQEIELFKLEVVNAGKRLAKDSAWIAAGAAIVGVGGLCLVLGLALGLGALLDSYWLGTLITGGILLLIGALFAWKGIGDLKKGGLLPMGSVESIQEDRSWAGDEVEDFKQGLTRERQ